MPMKTLQTVDQPPIQFLKIDHEDTMAYRKVSLPILTPGNYVVDGRGNDSCLFRAKPLPIDDGMELDEDQKAVFDRVLTFFSERQRYLKMGFRHKRGVLLYGDPGTGKTTLIRSIVNEFIARGAISLVCDVNELESALNNCRHTTDVPVIWTFEDIDSIRRGDEEYLTQILDGMNGLNNDNVLFLATSNYIERVSKRLKNRPGRFDEKIEVGFPGINARRAYIVGLIKDEPCKPSELEALVKLAEGLTVAHIKELVIRKFIYHASDDDMKTLAKELRAQCKENEHRDRSDNEDE